VYSGTTITIGTKEEQKRTKRKVYTQEGSNSLPIERITPNE
jgi:hypothetical protein